MTVGELAACLVNAETGTVTIKSKTDNKTIALDYGHADIRIGTNITAGSLDIGSKSAPASGSITVGGNYASMPIIILKTGAGINDAGTLAGKALTIDAVGAVNMSRFVHAVNLLQIAAGAGFLFKNDGALAISGITSGGAVNVEAAGAITISDSATINGAFNLKGTLLAIGNNDPGGAQTELAASSMMFDAPLVTGNITFDGNLAFSQSLVELTGHIINRKTISAASAQKLYFNGNYTGLDGALLKGTNGTTEIHFRKDAEFAVSPVSGHEDNGSWLVFSGTETQQFNSGGHVLGNVRIQKGGGELRLEGSDVIQRGNATLMIEEGLLHLAHESGPGGTIQMGWTMGIPDTAGQARGGNFFALGGTLSFANNSGIGAELRAMDIVLGENAALSASGAGNNTMAAMGNIDIAGNTAGNKNFGNSSLVMIPGSGAERTQIASETDLFRLVVLRPAELVGDITLTEMQLGSPAYAQINSVSVAYADSISLDGGSSVIRVLGNWINHCVDTNSDGITRTFVYGTGKVIFDRTSNSDKVIAIRGGTAWHTFICESPGAIIQFDNYPSRHYVAHKLTVKGAAGADGSIALTRLLDAGQPDRKPPDTSQPLLPLTEEDHKRYWDLVLQPSADGLGGTTMELENVMITYSNSNLRVPIPSRDKGVLAYPFYNRNNPSPPAAYPGSDYGSYSYYNINWVIRYSFIYAFTEDANGNGRIDRIRAQSAYELNSGEGGAFDKISIRVAKNDAADEEWIKVKGYGMTPGHPDSIYIYLEEHDYADGGAKDLAIHIEANESLMDLATGLSPVTNPVDDPLLTIDTAFPRITYALMLPSSNKAFVQFSEDIDDALMKFVYPDNQSPVEVARVGTGRKNEFELGFAGTGYDASVLASGPLFSVTGIKDIAVHARDKNEDDPDFPSPKYPVDWKYSDYAVVPGNPPSPAAGNVLIPPNALPGTILFHRVTDFLVSDYPMDYFAMPVWAMNPQENVGPNQGAHVARVFNGSDYLEDKDIALEINVNPALVGYTPEMLFSSAVPEAYRAGSSPVDPDFGVDHGITGLWLPPFASLGYDADATPPENARAFSNMVAEPYQSAYVVSALNASSNGNFNFKLEKNAAAYSYAAVSTLEFFLRLIPPVANPDFEYLCVGRLGKGSPWYRHIEPFKFELHNVTRQRGGVTILNNVIKPSTGEQVYVDYTLPRSGPVTVQVFTLDGNLVKTLSREHKAAGEYRSGWDGKNNGGREVARGMYFIRVVAPDIDEIRKVMVVK
jgi:hypothetical protein